MTTRHGRLFGGVVLSGALLLGTAGLAFATDPTASPGPDRIDSNGSSMTDSQGMSHGSSMMDEPVLTGAMTSTMGTMHASMVASGTCDSGTR